MSPLLEQHVKKIDLVGYAKDRSPIFHIETKGGHHRFVKKVGTNKYLLLGHGPSKTHARLMAEELEKNAEWSEVLFKSEGGSPSAIKVDVSAYEKQAEWYAKTAQKQSDPLAELFYTVKSIQYLEACGLEKSKAIQKYNEILAKMNKNETLLTSEPPYSEELLIAAYELQYQRKFPSLGE